ncbi:MAG: hypothetical protein P4L49_02065 [Desulfosporosinus sp.]|nr:hypothetical protein [Desulfosporosinus sp.]
MASNLKKDAEWVEAKKKCRLNDETLKMAREMGAAGGGQRRGPVC